MPIDLADTDPKIVVTDRHGAAHAFSRGLLATSLLATGVLTDEAFRLASLVQARLRHHERHDIGVDDLAELTRVTLLDESGPDVAARWEAWLQFRQSGRPVVLVLGGAPGVGKSVFARRLAVRLGVHEVVSTDTVREVLRLAVPPVVMPELHRSPYELAEETFDAYERQCHGVTAAAATVAARHVDAGQSVIVEGIHLLPGAVTGQLAAHDGDPLVIERLITIAEPNEHNEYLLESAAADLDHLETNRSIQARLVERATAAGVTIIDGRDTADLGQQIVDELIDANRTSNENVRSARHEQHDEGTTP